MSTIKNTLPRPNRYITTHDPSGKAILSKTIPAEAQWQHLGHEASFFLGYCTNTFPVDLSTPSLPSTPTSTSSSQDSAVPKDIASYNSYLHSPPGLTLSSGTILRYVDMAPDHTSPMHRTVSLDYGVVLEGEIELVLDSGETKLLKRGDTAIQRATAHAWRNPSKTEWTRMLFVLVPCEALEVDGKKLGEDLGHMEGVRGSD